VQQESEYLRNFGVIASFIGRRPSALQFQQWRMLLQRKVQGLVSFERNLGRGFFLLKTNNTEVVRSLLLLTLFHSDFGLCVFQQWDPGFDPETKRGFLVEGAGR
jgi:hypothetical protein